MPGVCPVRTVLVRAGFFGRRKATGSVETGGHHMPEIVDLGTYGEDFTANPYKYYAKLRAQGPVHHVRIPQGPEVWLVVGHEAVRAALTDPRLSKDWRTAGLPGDAGEEA